ncbi:MAG: hypothetical protein AAF810_02485 [Cyanobacteria bacterium P01_D01_bin.36]
MSLLPEAVQTWFPPDLQQRYVDHILMQSNSHASCNLTSVQAGHLVRLWGYAHIKQYGSSQSPIKTLSCRLSSFFCSNSEAANLFYAERNGTARSANQMLKRLESRSLIQCESSPGSPTKIRLNIPREYELPAVDQNSNVLPDTFVPRRDARILASLLTVLFQYEAERSQVSDHDISQVLREWSSRYPEGLRVLREVETKKPIAVVAAFPVHPDSESKFGLPPSESLYLHQIRQRTEDPIQFAKPANQGCRVAYIRCWHIKPGWWTHKIVLQLLQETQNMLQRMYRVHPELCDVYSVILHPHHEDLAIRLGFDITRSDPKLSKRWTYIALDHFLELNGIELLQDFDFEPYNRSSFM